MRLEGERKHPIPGKEWCSQLIAFHGVVAVEACTGASLTKVTLLSLAFLFSMPYVKGQKFDIQFTFNRLSVQMEHRACERITPVSREEMRHVLFPQEENCYQRGEINKTVRQVLVGK